MEGSPLTQLHHGRGPLSLSATDATVDAERPGPSSMPSGSINKYSSCTVKIVKAEMKTGVHGKPEFNSLENVYIELNSSNANIT